MATVMCWIVVMLEISVMYKVYFMIVGNSNTLISYNTIHRCVIKPENYIDIRYINNCASLQTG